jgi:hypothetical protein
MNRQITDPIRFGRIVFQDRADQAKSRTTVAAVDYLDGEQEAIIYLLIVPLKNWITVCGVQENAGKAACFEVSPDNLASTIFYSQYHNKIM